MIRTCPTCNRAFTARTPNQRFCSPRPGQHRSTCASAAQNRAYRAQTEQATCARCGGTFELTRSVTQRIYCSDFCHHAAKHERYSNPENVGRTAANVFPIAAPDPLRGEDVDGYVESMLRDPCAYCGEPSVCADHIVPRQADGDDDWTNFTGACKRCNSRKTFTPLLLFLGWDKAQREFEPWRAAVGAVHREFRDARLAA